LTCFFSSGDATVLLAPFLLTIFRDLTGQREQSSAAPSIIPARDRVLARPRFPTQPIS